ncbi:hypothetical protein A1D31_40050 [Bradyrhizobium liaoningense]|nr:hypothetical protein A1D31_40050 [Bradyrhizobium liaoningense]
MTARPAKSMADTQKALQQVQLSNQRLEWLAATDPLTGAGNRRHFIEHIGAEIARAMRTGAPLSLLSLDLDHFKDINDSRGHSVGDEVLRVFVRKCLEAIRPYDSVARVGGEEFMVLAPRSTRLARSPSAFDQPSNALHSMSESNHRSASPSVLECRS